MNETVAIGIGTMKLVELIKEVVPWSLQPWTKSVSTIVIAGTAVGIRRGRKAPVMGSVITTLAAAGVAALAHQTQRYLLMKGDEAKVAVMVRTTRPVRA